MAPITAHTIKNACTRYPTLKLLSLSLAFCIWVISSVSQKSELRLTLPVRIGATPRGYAATGPAIAAVDVTLTGPRHMLNRAKRSNQALSLDLENAVKPGTTTFMHLESYLNLPEGITVTRISPTALEIRLEAEHTPQGETRP
jgi:hypothetical protein